MYFFRQTLDLIYKLNFLQTFITDFKRYSACILKKVLVLMHGIFNFVSRRKVFVGLQPVNRMPPASNMFPHTRGPSLGWLCHTNVCPLRQVASMVNSVPFVFFKIIV